MAFALRQANEQDERTIKALVRASNINPLGIHWQRFIVAEDADRIVGIGQVKVHGDGSRELASIATVPDRQREGIATAVIEALLASDAGTSSSPLYLTCRAPTRPFYERFGFHTVEQLADMPPYFRRIMRIARVLFAIGSRLGREAGGLVMVRKGM
jgi:N-acetylglutamate synthase-like GNAT family acetyltransferase